MDPVAKIIGFLALLAAILTIANSIFKKSGSRPKDFPYRKKEYLLNAKGYQTFNTINKIVGSNFYVFPKVNLSKLVLISNTVKNFNTHIKRLKEFNVDFIICNSNDYSIEMAILIENPAKQKTVSKNELNQILNSANIKFITLQSNKNYDFNELRSLIRDSMGQLKEVVAINS